MLAVKFYMKVCNSIFITYNNPILTIIWGPANIHHLIGNKILPLLNLLFVAVEDIYKILSVAVFCLLLSYMFSKMQTCTESYGLIKTSTVSQNFTFSW